jgi:hypothetical protein
MARAGGNGNVVKKERGPRAGKVRGPTPFHILRGLK